ncbi:MAG: hypothetical protein ABI556_12105 [Gemmatimonadales bacterium]
MNRPFLWGWAAAAIGCFILLLRIRATRARAMVLITFGVTCAMFLAEAAAAVYNARRSTKGSVISEYSPPSVTNYDHELGFALKPGARVLHTRKWADSTLFSVTYTITDAGVRRTRGNARGDTWLFVGCSFTFGEGVEDYETLPARFSEQLGWKANVVNLAVFGYGPHQMLRMLETGRLGGAERPVKHVIYQAIPHHVTRAVGRASWDLDGPSYRISGDSIRFAGPFHSSAGIRAIRILRSSDLGHIVDWRYRSMAPSDADIELYARIVEKAAALSRKKLGAPFTILFWDEDGDRTNKRIFDRLVATGLPVIRTTSFLTRRELDSLQIPHDRHPTPEVYRRLAVGLAAHFGETSPNKAR